MFNNKKIMERLDDIENKLGHIQNTVNALSGDLLVSKIWTGRILEEVEDKEPLSDLQSICKELLQVSQGNNEVLRELTMAVFRKNKSLEEKE